MVLDDNRKPKYSVLFEFTDRPTAEAFSRAVLRAIGEFDPYALRAIETVEP